MKCLKCQFENPVGSKFCGGCGHKFDFTCPECGANNPAENKFCNECGSGLKPVKEVVDQIKHTKNLSISHPKKIIGIDTPTDTSERKYVTVLFSDLTGYTAMSERLDPEEVKEITSRIFSGISKIVDKYDGFIEKYAGDAVLAIFGIPKAHEDDPIRAVRVAREIHELVDAISPEVESRIGQSVSMHTGINTGLVVTGEVNMERGTHGVVGDTINLASRLSNLAKPGEILIDTDTCLQVEGHFECEYSETTTVKGKSVPVQVHKVISQKEKPVTIRRLSGVRAYLVGRKVEMAELTDAVVNLHEGKGRIFSISGDAGTGKSRLVEEFKATLNLNEIQWIEGHAYAYTQNIPYSLIIDLLNRVFQIKEDDPIESIRKKIESGIEHLVDNSKDVTPYVGGLYSLSYPEVEEVSPELWKSRLQEAISAILTAFAKKASTIFFLEDLHWADPSFVELLRRACLEIRQPAIVLCVYRPIFSLFKSHQVSSIGKLYYEMHLDNLSRSESQEMVQSLLKTEKIPSELQRFIKRNIEGNPFYLEEAINSLIESNVLARDNGRWRVTRHISDADISSSVKGVISARVDRLEQKSKRILQEASVIGRSFYYEILKRTTALKKNIDKSLSYLEHLDFIKTKSIQPDLEYIFKHSLTQEVIYNGLLKKDRYEIHERIAIVIELLFKDRLPEFYETLAFHFARGLSLNKAIYYLMKSGKKSLDRYSVEEAHKFYQQAFEILSAKTEKSKEEEVILIDLLNSWGYVYYYLGDFKDFTTLFGAYQGLAESLGDDEKIGMFYAWFGISDLMSGRAKNAYDHLIRAKNLGKNCDNLKIEGYACTWLSWTCAELGLYDEGICHGERAQQIAKEFPADQYLFFKSLAGLAFVYTFKGLPQKALECGKLLLDHGRKYSNSRSNVMGHYASSMGYAMAGDFKSCIKSSRQAIAVSKDPFYSQFPAISMDLAYTLDGQFDSVLSGQHELLEFCEKYQVGELLVYENIIRGAAMVASGKMDHGLKMIEECRKISMENHRKTALTISEYVLGMIYSQIATGPTPKLSIMVKNVRFLMKNLPFASINAEDHYQKAIELSEEIGANGYRGISYLGLGQFYQTKNKTDKARQCIYKAIEILEECKSENYLRQAKEALKTLS